MSKGLRLKIFVTLSFFLFLSLCYASMTIYFKDGTSRDVHKITFRGKVAELFLLDGSIITVPAEKLDLTTSGIGAPVGTYGTSKVTGARRPALVEKKGVLGDPLKQTRLREEWQGAEKTATVTSTIGPMQTGDTVKIVRETTANTRPTREDYYDQSEYEYDPERRRYRFRAKNLDHAYVVVYKNQDGSYGKRLFDAATFNSHFQLSEIPKSQAPLPEYPIIPDKKDPDVHETTPLTSPQPKPEITEPESLPPPVQQQEAAPAEQPPTTEEESGETEEPSRRSSWIAYAIFVAVVIAIGLGAWFILVRGQKPYIDASKFLRYEDDLREFEIAIWLRNRKTADQLMEICLKKFYQDSPAILSVCNRMLKGTQKALVVPFIAKQTNRSVMEAEKIYDQIHLQMERIRNLIQEVSQRTGISPAKPVEEITSKTGPVDLPRTVTAAKAPVPTPPPLPKQMPVASPEPAPAGGNSTSAISMNAQPAAERPVGPHLIEPQSPMRTATDLPSYANNVLSQISFLSSREEK